MDVCDCRLWRTLKNCEELLGTFQNNKLQETKNGSIHYKNGSKFS